jgi:hypothetical protein
LFYVISIYLSFEPLPLFLGKLTLSIPSV